MSPDIELAMAPPKSRGDEIFLLGGDKIRRVDFGEHLSAPHRIAGRGDR